MNSKAIIILGIILLLLAALYFFKPDKKETNTIASTTTKQTITTTNELPNLLFTKADGTKLSARDLKDKTILIFFHPDCDHCQREITQIRENKEVFKKHQLYFLSDAALPLITQFTQDYKVATEPNFTFAHTEILDVLNSVGPIATPSVYIYAENGKLVKAFNGETPIENILPFL